MSYPSQWLKIIIFMINPETFVEIFIIDKEENCRNIAVSSHINFAICLLLSHKNSNFFTLN